MAQGGSSTENPHFKMDRCSPLWKYVEIIRPMPGGGGCVWICSHCKEESSSSYSRVKAHLCFIPQKGIKFCTGKPRVNGKLPKTLLPNHIVNKYIQEQKQADEAAGRASAAHPLQSGRPSKKGKMSSMSSTSVTNEPPAEGHPFLHSPQQQLVSKKTTGPLEASFNNDARDIADQAIARCVYANGLSFNVVRSPYWQYMVRAVNEAPKGFKGPGYEKIRTTLLDDEVARVDAAMLPIKDTWTETGVTIVSDGWKDARNRPLVNVIAVSTRGAMFLRAVDCEGQVKDGPFIANILIQAIEQVGPQNVVQVVTDNAKNCGVVGLLVEERYEHIFWPPCSVHSLNLMLQKIGTKVE